MKAVLQKVKHKTRIRTRYRSLKKKAESARYIYRTNGGLALAVRVKDEVKKYAKRSEVVRHAGDVLFVSINEPLLDRYRTDHMIESLESTGMSVGKVYYHELTREHIKRYNVFVFYRCPWVPEFEAIFEDIRSKNKVSIYAVDDLVIDRKYTDNLPPVLALTPEDRRIYDDGVERHGRLMKACDHAIVTTRQLAEEIKKYKELDKVYIDRNAMSEEMIYCAENAIAEVKRDEDKIIIGYFSGTNTHNEDFQMVAPAMIRILEEYKNTYIKLAGRIDAPDALKGYEDRLLFAPYVDWRRLPYELRECDITLSPLIDTLFNRAKSEIKWAESALVEVPTVASDMGAFKDMVKHGETGVLVENTEDAWFKGVESLVKDAKLRQKIAKNARLFVARECSTTGDRAVKLREFIDSVTPRVVAFGGVNLSAISGGNMVVKKHMDILREAGNIVYGVESMDYRERDRWAPMNKKDDEIYDIFRIKSHRRSDKIELTMSFDIFVATFWDSVKMVDEYSHMKKDSRKLYLVQNKETGFYKGSDAIRRRVAATYRNQRLTPVTISKWCQEWLATDFDRTAKYAPNGLELEDFPYSERDWKNRKVKVLIEGDSSSEYKRVDESFKVANELDKTKYEVAYLSYNAEPKAWYEVDNTYIKVPSTEVGKIYTEHDILIKSSVLESFSYPPIELMATGGVPVLVKNGGNAEYVQDGENALYYKEGDIDDALAKVEKLVANKKEFRRMAKNGQKTATKRDWSALRNDVIELYR